MSGKEQTLSYYGEHALDFVRGTINADMGLNREKFLERIPKHGRILDFGCGSGRNAKAFLEMGYVVEAIDGCRELCKMAIAYTGISVRQIEFLELNERGRYDGIWACASVLHLLYEELKRVLVKMEQVLKDGGVMYVSFKYGDFEGWRNGRYFTDMTEEGIEILVGEMDEVSAEEVWVTADVREDRGDKRWVNGVVRKRR